MKILDPLPPGNILINHEIEKYLKKLRPNRSLEIGSGNGQFTNILIKHSAHVTCIDFNKNANDQNKLKNFESLKKGKLIFIDADFLNYNFEEKNYDLIISQFVIEHLTVSEANKFVKKCHSMLSDYGSLILLVPANMKYFSLEDEIYGHLRRYSYKSFSKIFKELEIKNFYIRGLTFPLSNLLFPLSKFIVKKNHNDEGLSNEEKTQKSGTRDEYLKAKFPKFFIIFLNKYFLYIFIILQNLFKFNKSNMVLMSISKNKTDSEKS